MKAKTLLLTALMLLSGIVVNAQSYRNSRYYDSRSNSLNYSHPGGYSHFNSRMLYGPRPIYGLHIGPTFSTLSSDDDAQNASSVFTGINVGMTLDLPMSRYAPVYFETGLSYVQKGGNSSEKTENSYSLGYLEVPLALKYIFTPNRRVSIQPFVGGYLAAGVNGKMKMPDTKRSTSAFGDSSDKLQRFDGGLRLGCGVGYDVLYAELSYEYGLSDLSKGDYNSTHNSSVMLTVGVNL